MKSLAAIQVQDGRPLLCFECKERPVTVDHRLSCFHCPDCGRVPVAYRPPCPHIRYEYWRRLLQSQGPAGLASYLLQRVGSRDLSWLNQEVRRARRQRSAQQRWVSRQRLRDRTDSRDQGGP